MIIKLGKDKDTNLERQIRFNKLEVDLINKKIKMVFFDELLKLDGSILGGKSFDFILEDAPAKTEGDKITPAKTDYSDLIEFIEPIIKEIAEKMGFIITHIKIEKELTKE